MDNFKSGQEVEITVQVTTYHKGYFEFKLCPNNNVNEDPVQDCFDKWVKQNTKYDLKIAPLKLILLRNLLEVVNGDGTKYYPHGGSKTYRKDLFFSSISNTGHWSFNFFTHHLHFSTHYQAARWTDLLTMHFTGNQGGRIFNNKTNNLIHPSFYSIYLF